MRHAILITAYKDFDRIKRFVDKLDDRFSVYVHIDRKSKITESELSELSSLRNSRVYSKYIVNWGGINHLSAILMLAEEAFKEGGVEFFHVISAQDIMVVDNNTFCDFFTEHRNNSFIDYEQLPNNWYLGGFYRLDYYNFYDTIDFKKTFGELIITNIVRLQRHLHLKRKKIPLQPLYGMGTWWSLNVEAMSYLLSYLRENPAFYRRFRHTFCAEEVLPHTVLLHSPLSATIVNNDLRYVDWEEKHGSAPAILDETDFEKIIGSGDMFARKIASPYSDKLEAMIAERAAQTAARQE